VGVDVVVVTGVKQSKLLARLDLDSTLILGKEFDKNNVFRKDRGKYIVGTHSEDKSLKC